MNGIRIQSIKERMVNMKKLFSHLFRLFILFLIGGFIYMGIELLWRGRTHWTMGIVGGICFVLIGLINELFTFEMYILTQAIIGAILVTIVEYISGCIINIHFGLAVWDYSNLPFNIQGQVCLLFSFLWVLLSVVAIYADDILRNKLFGEEMKKYKWFIFRNCNK